MLMRLTFGALLRLLPPLLLKTVLHRNSTVARRVTNVTSEHYGDP